MRCKASQGKAGGGKHGCATRRPGTGGPSSLIKGLMCSFARSKVKVIYFRVIAKSFFFLSFPFFLNEKQV